MTNQTAKTIKTIKNSNTTDPSKNLYLRAQEWICDRIQDSESEIESLTSSILPDSPKHDLKDSTIFHQSPQTSSDETKRNQSDSDQSGKALPDLHFAWNVVDFGPFCAYCCSRVILVPYYFGDDRAHSGGSKSYGDVWRVFHWVSFERVNDLILMCM